MSWASNNVWCNRENLEREVADMYIASPPDVTSEMRDQLHVAKQAVMKFVENTKVIGNYKYYQVRISGHANEGHIQADNWGSDFVTITIFGDNKSPDDVWGNYK